MFYSSWATTAQYIMKHASFTLSIPFNRYAVPHIQSIIVCRDTQTIQIRGIIADEYKVPPKTTEALHYKVIPETPRDIEMR